MSASQPSAWELYWDSLIVLGSLAFGCLLPKLHPLKVEMSGKVVIVTGANSGIGYYIALDLYGQGASVYLACRNESKARAAISEIRNAKPESKGSLNVLILDTSSLDSVRKAASELKDKSITIDVLVHNAGIGSIPEGQQYSPDGFPVQYATNLLGSFLFTYLVEQNLSAAARILFTSSTASYSGSLSSSFALSQTTNKIEPGFHVAAKYTPDIVAKKSSPGYGNTKAMQVAFGKLLQARFDQQAKLKPDPNGQRKIAHVFSPGFTSTAIFTAAAVEGKSFWADPMFWILRATEAFAATDVSQGAATGVWLATTDDTDVIGEGKGGGYWDRMSRRINKVDMWKWEKLERLWIRWEADAGIEWR